MWCKLIVLAGALIFAVVRPDINTPVEKYVDGVGDEQDNIPDGEVNTEQANNEHVVDKMLKFMENQEDHLVGAHVQNSKTIELTFHDEAKTFLLCSMQYTVGDLHLTVHDGDSIDCAEQRVEPRIEIKENEQLIEANNEHVVDKMLKFMENQEDHLVGAHVQNSKTIELTFHDEAKTFLLCSMQYTVGDLHLTVHDGDSIDCAEQRVEPRIEIKENEQLIEDGLYALVVVDRDLEGFELDGTLDEPYLHYMVLNIHGSDFTNANVAREWEAVGWSEHFQLFLYRQSHIIYSDFALAKYTINGNGCDTFNRCHFSQNRFVRDYNLVLDSVIQFDVGHDPWSAWLFQPDGWKTALVGCIEQLTNSADTVMENQEVDTDGIDEVLKAWQVYTLQYMSESYFDALIPYQTVMTHKVGFWFQSEPETIGPMCGVKFHLPGVDMKCFLDQEISAAGLRDMPKIKILNAETHHEDTENYFTLILADRTEGVYSENVQTKDEPYLLWFVMNIKDNDLKHASQLVPYLPGYDYTANVVLLYKQLDGSIREFPIYEYTESSCASEARCRFEVVKFRERYNLELVSASNYTITGDVYSAMALMRRGLGTPDDSCPSVPGLNSTQLKEACRGLLATWKSIISFEQ